MKKAHNANIGGTVFQIDEDAYIRLDAYLKSVAVYFASFPDHSDITADIEGRIAEQLKESEPPRIVTIAALERVIAIMGSADQFAEVDLADRPQPSTGAWPRRLYRDTDGRIIAGVASGLAAFINLRPIVVRALFVLLLVPNTFLRLLSMLSYLTLWAFIPAAKTATDNLRMRGNAVTLATVEQRVRERLIAIEQGTRGTASVFVFALGSLIHRLVLSTARLAGIAGILAAGGGVIVCTVILVTTIVNAQVQPFGANFATFIRTLNLWSYPFIICSYVIAVVPLVFAGAFMVKALNTRYAFKMQWGIILFTVWFVSLLTSAGIAASHVQNL